MSLTNWKTAANKLDKDKRNSVDSPARHNTPSPQPSLAESEEAKMLSDIATLNSLSIRYNKFKALLEAQVVDLEQLRKLAWSGIPGINTLLSR